MAFTGKCMCGAIRYSAEGRPVHHALCHCDHCRASSGAYVIGWALFPNEAVTIEGEPVSYRSSADATREFCGTCGTGLFYRNEGLFPDQVDIQSGTLDDPDALPPQARIQVAEAPSWMEHYADLPGFERFPG